MRLVDITTASLADRLQRFAPACVVTPDGTVDYRQAGPRTLAVTHVLLHGIGSGSASWLTQLEAAELSGNARVLAWEAPGYGRSSPVTPLQPSAGDYAVRLWAWLDNLSILNPVTLVGHSLGAIGTSPRLCKGERSRKRRKIEVSAGQFAHTRTPGHGAKEGGGHAVTAG